MKTALITGSSGLVGSQMVEFLSQIGWKTVGIDNDMRADFFGKQASTTDNNRKLISNYPNFHYINCDIRDSERLTEIFKQNRFDLILHTAAQPSHDWSARHPMVDFSINADATLLLLENFRKYAKEAVFIFTSTNKVYGNNPNLLPLKAYKTRFDLPKNHLFYNGIPETMSLDRTTHSIFGVSKCAADLMVQEYGRYFNLLTVVFRCGCLTGPAHRATSLHGFLAYLVKCIKRGTKYTILGYQGKQVRDNIHVYDLVRAFYEFYRYPRKGEVYNMGGSRFSNISIIEAIDKIENLYGKKAHIEYKDNPRIGDHKWYISDISKFKKDYRSWSLTYSIDQIIEDLVRHSGK